MFMCPHVIDVALWGIAIDNVTLSLSLACYPYAGAALTMSNDKYGVVAVSRLLAFRASSHSKNVRWKFPFSSVRFVLPYTI